MWASSEGRRLSRVWWSWLTHVSNEVTMVSSAGTLTSSEMSSLSISSTGSSRNSWPPTTSKKCSWQTDKWKSYVGRRGRDQKDRQNSHDERTRHCWWQSEMTIEGKMKRGREETENEGMRKIRQTRIRNTWTAFTNFLFLTKFYHIICVVIFTNACAQQ